MRNKQILLSGRAITTNAANVPADRYSFLHLSDAEPNLGTANANGWVLVYDTSTPGNRLWSKNLITAYDHANSAYDSQNTTGVYANAAFLKANSAYESQNVTGTYANNAYIHANAANLQANSAYESQNVTGTYANNAYLHANAAFDKANAAYASQNVTGTYANNAYAHANAANLQANSAYESQNVTGTYANNAYLHANSAYSSQNTTGTYANAAFLKANSAYQSQNVTGTYANNAYLHANSAYDSQNTTGVYANAAFLKANSAYESQNVTGTYANNAYLHANSAYASQNTTGVYANAAFLKANSAYESQNVTGTYANAAYAQANSASLYANGAFVEANSAYDSQNTTGVYANAAYAQANSASLYANGAFVQANSAYQSQNVTGTYANAAYAQANSASLYANGAFVQANAGFLHSNSAYESQNTTGVYANSAYAQANSASLYANGAFVQANAAFDKANAAYASQNVTGTYANNAYAQANAGTALAQNAYDNSNTKYNITGGTIAGNVTIANNLTVLGNVNFVGNVTSLQVTGNSGQFFGDASNGFNALYAGIPVGYDFQPQTVFQVSANDNGYAQINIQNINNGGDASGDYVVTADNGTENDTYVDLGIGSSTHSDPDFTLVGPNDAYLYAHGNTSTSGGDLVIGTFLENDVVFAAGGMNVENEQMRILGSSNTIAIRANVDTTNSKSITLGPIANVHIAGGSDDDYIRTDGLGNLTFASLTSANVIKVLYTTTNASFVQANSAYNSQNATGVYANAAFLKANSAYESQNTTGVYANAAFLKANSAYDSQNVTGTYANNAYSQANSASLYANGAFVQANASYDSQNTTGVYANAAFLKANSAYESQNVTGTYANNAYLHANSAYESQNTTGVYANAAFLKANSAYESQNVTGTYANNAYLHANSAYESQNVTGTYANNAYLHANSAYESQNTTGVYANAAFLKANSAYESQNVTGTYANNAYLHANSAYESQNTTGVYANAAFLQANSAYASQNVTGTYANNAYLHANSAYASQNVTGTYANNAYLHANSAYDSQNTTGVYANSAFLQSNSAYTHANAAYSSQNVTGTYANSAFAKANAAVFSITPNTNQIWTNTSSGNIQIGLANVNSNIGVWGGNEAIPVINVDGFGRILSVSNTTISVPPGTYIFPNTNQLTSNASSGNVLIGLANVNNNIGTWGGNEAIPVINVDGYGRILSVSNTTISVPPGTYIFPNTGQLTANANSGNILIGLAQVASNIGIYGNSLSIPTLNIDVYGRVVSVTNSSISIPEGTYVVNSNLIVSNSSTGNVVLGLANSGVIPGVYGGTGNIPVVTVDQYGRVISAANIASTVSTLSSIQRASFTATAAQTTFTLASSFEPGYCDVYVNGIKLSPADYVANPVGSVYISNPVLLAGDVVDIQTATTFTVDANASYTKVTFTATAGQTVFNTTYIVGGVNVYLNGLRLYDTVDYYANNGTSITINSALEANDIVEVERVGSKYLYFQNQYLATRQTINVPSNGQTTFTITGGYKLDFVDVFLNGIKLNIPNDVVANNGSTITILSPTLESNDIIEVVGIGPEFTPANAIPTTGGNVYGSLIISNNVSANAVNVATVYFNDGTKMTTAASGRGDGVTWKIASANVTANLGEGLLVDTTSASVYVTLNASPYTGNTTRILDMTSNFAINNCIIKGNGQKIMGSTDDLVISSNNAGIGLVYSNSTHGWRIIENP